MTQLQSHCDCGRYVRVLWSSPINMTSRPVMLVCGWHPERRCEFRQAIPIRSDPSSLAVGRSTNRRSNDQ